MPNFSMPTSVYDIVKSIQNRESLTESELLKAYHDYQGDENMFIENILKHVREDRNTIDFTSSFSCMSDKYFTQDVQVTNFIQFHDKYAGLPISKKLLLRDEVSVVKVYNKMIEISDKQNVFDRGCSRPLVEQVDSAYWRFKGQYDLGELNNDPQDRLVRMIRELHLHMMCCATSEKQGASFNQAAISAGINILLLIRVLCEVGRNGDTLMNRNTFKSIAESVQLPMANEYDFEMDNQIMNEKAVSMTRAVLWHIIGKEYNSNGDYDDNADVDVTWTKAWVKMIEDSCSSDLLEMAVNAEFYVARVSTYIGSALLKNIELYREVAVDVKQYNTDFYDRFIAVITQRNESARHELDNDSNNNAIQLGPGASIYGNFDTTEQSEEIDGFQIRTEAGIALESFCGEYFLLRDTDNKKKARLSVKDCKFTVIREYGNLKALLERIPFKSFGFSSVNFELADKVFTNERNDSTYWANAMLRGALGVEAGLWALACITCGRVPIKETDVSYLQNVPKKSAAETNVATPLGSNVLSSLSLVTDSNKLFIKYEGISDFMELRKNRNYIHCILTDIDDKEVGLRKICIKTKNVLG